MALAEVLGERFNEIFSNSCHLSVFHVAYSGNDTASRAEDPEFESGRTCFSLPFSSFECKVLMSQMSQ